MSGTMASVTAATRFSPPSMTRPVSRASTMPVATGGTRNTACRLPAMELIWLIFPMPKLASTQKQANSTASARPKPPPNPSAR